MRASLLLGLLVAAAAPSRALDLDALWDFANPAASEARLRGALAAARGDDALILQTQIARTHGLRRDFERARALLREIEPQLATAGAEARCRHALELGRTFASAAHDPARQTDADREAARTAYTRALAIARDARLDGLAVDAIHMFAFVDRSPEGELARAQEALALVERSDQPAAKAWEASIRHNLGMALHRQQRFDAALVQFRAATALREARGDAQRLRVARWMEAWTLRALNRLDEALAIQQQLEREHEAAGTPDRHVFEELEALHRARGDAATAERYAARRQALAGRP